ncbi:MAG: hypothetical protein A2Y03_08855 [Omnitrophica WOR_2 bacterium GWF2_38_59]|nr:MAG: hypothetical protein A2Y06_05315 [Omnitrophica WOR_2 bacterium GWA2_37_7]OGX22088.1 MAG: hypothetical protein A2Y03_08855 [Omnitrophica WOR_2 bacterium GWF2_38_59]OGX46730.1 MAG: hypothetical protein A2243_02485 [Omnitrophica WOR_2 bacterium RIFOXYA2_FULL_38_17]OGX53421.1 MAG: hypothetical protein A2267_09765 [Omnitrophica WOR_2 bacterium RIFOXYA12_FULL_38_10]OGX56601.1 MAG: hypothetical protein A2447_07160 [Omnitrophica WOR_2 bacterium RIFOXYC2_FULL_38_12]OGX59820.1 MAG: hypothetical 
MKIKLRLFGFLLLSCACFGCGYTTRTTLPGNYRTIYIEDFANEITFTTEKVRNVYFPLLEVKIRNSIVDRFMFDGYLRVVDKEDADLVLKGTLKNYERDALRYTDNDDVEEYRVRVIVALELFDAENQEIAWSETSFAGEATYFLTGSQASTEESAVNDAIIDLAKRVVERTVEDW